MDKLSDFSSFILSLASSAFYYMGESPNPSEGKEINLEIAKHTIDTITMLENKTINNLSDKEKVLLNDVLYKLRTKFVKLKKEKGNN